MNGNFFNFEADFVQSLRCVPMIVRYKLDMCGVKLSLRSWSRFDHTTRARLVGVPVGTAEEIADYGVMVYAAIVAAGEQPVLLEIDSDAPWMKRQCIPATVASKAGELAIALGGDERWEALSALQRFALVKLTRGGHENKNFIPALREFGMLSEPVETGRSMMR